jgi:hypothetical protein
VHFTVGFVDMTPIDIQMLVEVLLLLTSHKIYVKVMMLASTGMVPFIRSGSNNNKYGTLRLLEVCKNTYK